MRDVEAPTLDPRRTASGPPELNAPRVEPRAATLLRAQGLVGNRAVGRMLETSVQRYKTVGTDAYESKPDESEDARAPFTLAGDEINTKARPEGKAGLGMGYDVTTPDQPPLFVADDDSLAINSQKGEPKEFYADPEVITKGNTTLKAVNSPIELTAAGNKVSVPHGEGGKKELVMVQPGIRGEKAPGVGKFVKLSVDVCRDAAKHILGGITHARIGKGDQSTHVPLDTTSPVVVGGTHKLAEQLTQGPVSVEEGKNALGSNESPKVGKDYGTGLSGEVGERGKDLGINEQARAKVGEGYVTQTIASEQDEGGTKKDYAQGGTEHEFVWGYHYSSVIAQSLAGDDQIAMENYARKGDLASGQEKLLQKLKDDFAVQINGLALAGSNEQKIGAILHRLETGGDPTVEQAKQQYSTMAKEQLGEIPAMWYFRILGSKEGQSFHEQMKSSGYFSNPMTLVVGSYDRSKPINISFGMLSAELEQIWKNNLNALVKGVLADVHQGRHFQVRVTGWDNDSGPEFISNSIAAKRTAAVADYLEAQGVNPALIDRVTGGPTKKFGEDGAANRKAEVTIV